MSDILKGILSTSMAAKTSEEDDSRKKKSKKEKDKASNERKSGVQPAFATQSTSAKDLRKSMEDDKRIKELSASFYDVQNKLKTIEMNNKGFGEELSMVRGNLSELKDNMKNLLLIYEVIAKTNNPFVTGGGDYGGYSDIQTAQARASEEEDLLEDGKRLGASEMLMFSSLFQTVRKIENHMEHIFKKRMSDEEPDKEAYENLQSWYLEFKNVLEMHRFMPKREGLQESMDELRGEDDGRRPSGKMNKVSFTNQDHNRLLTAIRITEHYLEKIVVQKVMGKDPPEAELEKLDYWYQEFVNWR